MDEVTIDAGGLACPLPIVRLAQAARRAAAGTRLRLWATDAAICSDLPAWCEATGHELLSLDAAEGGYWALVRTRVHG